MTKLGTTKLLLVAGFLIISLCSCATLLTAIGAEKVRELEGTSSTTSTTPGPTTTTNFVPGNYSISGQVSGTQFGTLFVVVFTNPSFSGSPATYESYNLSTGETTKSYLVPGVGNSAFYVGSILFVGRWNAQISQSMESGSKLGEYSDGNLPSSLGGPPPYGTPAAITVSGGNQTDKNYPLNVTWQ